MAKEYIDYVDTYYQFLEAQANAVALFEMYKAESFSHPPQERKAELKVLIEAQQVYINRLNKIINEWTATLLNIKASLRHKEYEMFDELIIKQKAPKETKWSLKTCYNFKFKINQRLANLKRENYIQEIDLIKKN